MESHLPARFTVGTCTASNGQHCVCTIVMVWPLDGNLPRGKNNGPEAFPHAIRPGNGANTLTIVNAYLLCVSRIEDGVMEGQHIPQCIGTGLAIIRVPNGVCNGMFDYMNVDVGIAIRVRSKYPGVHDEHGDNKPEDLSL